MFEAFLQLFARLVFAVEKLANAPSFEMGGALGAGNAGQGVGIGGNDAAKFKNTVETAAKLAALEGVQKQMVTDAQSKAVVVPFPTVPAPTPSPDAQQEKPQEISREIVGNALIALAQGKSRDLAVSVLAKYNNAVKLADVPASDYAKLFADIQKASV